MHSQYGFLMSMVGDMDINIAWHGDIQDRFGSHPSAIQSKQPWNVGGISRGFGIWPGFFPGVSCAFAYVTVFSKYTDSVIPEKMNTHTHPQLMMNQVNQRGSLFSFCWFHIISSFFPGDEAITSPLPNTLNPHCSLAQNEQLFNKSWFLCRFFVTHFAEVSSDSLFFSLRLLPAPPSPIPMTLDQFNMGHTAHNPYALQMPSKVWLKCGGCTQFQTCGEAILFSHMPFF